MTANVNSEAQKNSDINVCIGRLGKQMREILLYLYRDKEHVHKQVDFIREVFGEISPSRKSSVNRSFKILTDYGLVGSRKAYYSDQFNCWIRQRVCFYLTELGEEYAETLTSKQKVAAKLTFKETGNANASRKTGGGEP